MRSEKESTQRDTAARSAQHTERQRCENQKPPDYTRTVQPKKRTRTLGVARRPARGRSRARRVRWRRRRRFRPTASAPPLRSTRPPRHARLSARAPMPTLRARTRTPPHRRACWHSSRPPTGPRPAQLSGTEARRPAAERSQAPCRDWLRWLRVDVRVGPRRRRTAFPLT